MADASLADLPAPPQATVDSLPAPPMSLHERVNDIATGFDKAVVERALAAPMFLGDVVTGAANLGGGAIDKLIGKKNEPDLPLPSRTLEALLDKGLGPTRTGAGKAVEVAGSILSPTAKKITAAEEALFRASHFAEMRIASGKVPEAERIRQTGNSVGFQYSPSEVPGAGVSKQVTSLAGKARTEEEVSAHNLDKTQDLVAAEFHLPKGAEMSDETLQRLQKPAYDAYEKVANLGDIQTSPQYREEISRIGSWGAQVEKDFPEDTPQKVLALRGALAQAKFTGRGALEKIKQLREDYRTNIRGDSESKALARAQKDAADALEHELGRKAEATGQPQLLEEFKNARIYLAKIGAVRDALVAGKVSARSLAGQLSDGVPLTGNLKIIAESALQNPKSFQDVQKKGQMGAYTVHDLWALAAGGAGLMTGNTEGRALAGLAAASLSRPLARAAVRSRPVQRAITRPASEKIGAKASNLLAQHPGAGASAAVQVANQDFGDQGP